MCASASQILSSWIACPEDLDPSYLAFLNLHGGKRDPATVPVLSNDLVPNSDIYKSLTSWARVGQVFHDGFRACDSIHNDLPRQCIKHAGQFFIAGLRRATRVYVPLYAIFYVVAMLRRARQSTPTALLAASLRELPQVRFVIVSVVFGNDFVLMVNML